MSIPHVEIGRGAPSRGERIRLMRKRGDLTIDELAKLLSIGPNSLRAYEKDRREMPASIVGKLARIFDVSADYFLELVSWPRPLDEEPGPGANWKSEDTRVKRRGKASSLHSVPTLPEVIGPEPTSVQPPLAVSVH